MGLVKEYELKISTKEAQANLDELNKSLSAQEELVSDLEKELLGYNKSLDETIGYSGKAMMKRTHLNKKIAETKQRLAEEKQGLKDVNRDRKKANQILVESKKNTADYSGVLKILDNQTGGAISGFQNMTGSISGATKGFKLMRAAIIATGIGALVIAITSVATAFTSSEEGQNRFAKLMSKIGVIAGNVTDILSSFGTAIIKVFSGDFKGAAESIKETTEAIKNFGEETKKEMKIAGQLSDMRAEASKKERELINERAEANRKVAELREKAADKENVSVADRIAALKEAGRIEEEITKKEIEAAKLKFEAKKLENTLSKSTKEDLDEEAKLQAKLTELETARLKRQRTLTTTITRARKEQKAERDREIAEKEANAELEIQKEKEKEEAIAQLKKDIREAEANTIAEERALELEKIQQHYDALILQAQENDLLTDELKASRDEMLAEKQAEWDEEKKQKEAEDLANKQKIADEVEKIEQQKRNSVLATLDNAARLFGEESKLGKAMLIAKQVMLMQQLIMDAKSQLSTATKTVNESVVTGTGASTEVAGSIAKGANTAPPPANVPFIISAIATGAGILASVRSAIKGTKKAASKIGATTSTPTIADPTASVATASLPPEMTGVGGSGINQLASAIGEQSQQPVQAYVVSNDVTTSQSLERNIIDSASIG